MHYHHITEQTPHKIFATTPRGTSIPRSLTNTSYRFIQVKKEHYFGIETIWVDDMKAQITNIEKTLLDGLTSPEYCGDFNEVLHAFKIESSPEFCVNSIRWHFVVHLQVFNHFLTHFLQARCRRFFRACPHC
jgi:predicted transcriptional regulator of viral defense system